MPYKVFVSYSTRNMQIAQWALQSLSQVGVTEVFVAEYSTEPGTSLSERILTEIRYCDMFVLLWSGAARSSDWVPQEIGAARMANRLIVPVVLEANLPVPGFVSDIKYLRAFEDWQGAFTTLKNLVDAQAMEAANRKKGAIILSLILGAAALFSSAEK